MPKPRRRPPVSADRAPRPEPWSALLLAALVLSGCSGGDTGEIPSEDRGRRLGTGWVESFAWTGNGTVAYAVETPVNEVRVIEISEGSSSVLTG